jgi:Uma2 family endonuclease
MTTLARQVMTAEEFERWVALPQNRERRFERVDGEVIEVVSNEISAHVTAVISAFITMYAIKHQLGYTTSSESGYRIGGNDYMPDLAFISKSRRERPLGETWITVVPDLVVEVKSPADTYIGLLGKAADYIAAGTRVVWVVLPDKRRIEVYSRDDQSQFGMDDTLGGGDVLPGFTLNVSEVFAALSA